MNHKTVKNNILELSPLFGIPINNKNIQNNQITSLNFKNKTKYYFKSLNLFLKNQIFNDINKNRHIIYFIKFRLIIF